MRCPKCNGRTYINETRVDGVRLTATFLLECTRCGCPSTLTERLLPSSKLLKPTVSGNIASITYEGSIVIMQAKAKGEIRRQNSNTEARWLLRLLGHNGEDLGSIRAMIVVPPEIESQLRAFATNQPGESDWIEESLEYRKRVLEEFDRLAGAAACS